jgi:hypothetical protein
MANIVLDSRKGLMYIMYMEGKTMTSEIRKVNYTVSRTEDAWVVSAKEYDADNVAPRVTVVSVHRTRHDAIDAARALAGDSMYYVNDAPSAKITDEDKQTFWGR